MGITPQLDQNKMEYFPNSGFYEEEPTELVKFDDSSLKVCVGIVDIVGSTRITARLNNSSLAKLYGVFLNTIGTVITRYGGHVVKNIGDSILYYFPEISDKSQLVRCIECSLAILQAHDYLNAKLKSYGLPKLDYRVSSDYGAVAIAETAAGKDIFGQPVNVCSKINHLAKPNSLVVGSDFFQLARVLECYKFEEVSGYDSGLKFSYPVYAVSHDEGKIRKVVGKCIEKALMAMSTPDFEKVVSQLFEKHSCFLPDCYEKPQYLKEVLEELYGNASVTIVESIEKEIERQAAPKPLAEFMFQLR